MKRTTLLSCFCIFILSTFVFFSCSEDEDYSSYPPEFEDVTFSAVDGGDALRAGSEIKATVVQGKKGRLLNKTTYKWSIETVDNAFGDRAEQTIVYDKENGNPSAVFSLSVPGRYKLVFTARYAISGQPKTRNYVANMENGTVECSTSSFYYDVTITKTFSVR